MDINPVYEYNSQVSAPAGVAQIQNNSSEIKFMFFISFTHAVQLVA